MAEISIINVPSEEWQELKQSVKQNNELLKLLTEQSNKKYLTVKEAAEILHCNISTIHRYIENGYIRVKERKGKRQKILIPADQIAEHKTKRQL